MMTLSCEKVAGFYKEGRAAIPRPQKHVQQGQIALSARMLATIILRRIHVPDHQRQDPQSRQMIAHLPSFILSHENHIIASMSPTTSARMPRAAK